MNRILFDAVFNCSHLHSRQKLVSLYISHRLIDDDDVVLFISKIDCYRHTSLAMDTVFRVLESLEYRGYIEKTGKYRGRVLEYRVNIARYLANKR